MTRGQTSIFTKQYFPLLKYSDIFERKLLVLIFLSQNPYGFYNQKNDFLYNLLFPLKAFNFFELP